MTPSAHGYPPLILVARVSAVATEKNDLLIFRNGDATLASITLPSPSRQISNAVMSTAAVGMAFVASLQALGRHTGGCIMTGSSACASFFGPKGG